MAFFVSVIIPVWNGERYLAEAIASVLAQKHSPLELVIVDDGSTDDTREVAAKAAKKYGERIRYVEQPHRGVAAARNLGIVTARGNVVSFLDYDDLWEPDCLPRHLAVLDARPEIEIVQGLIVQMQRAAEGSVPGECKFEISSEPYQFISLSSAVYRRKVFERVGGFDETLTEGEDADWFLRAWEQDVPKVVLPQVMLYYRRHETNMTQDAGPRLLPRLFKMHLDRMRSAGAQTTSPRQSVVDYIGQPPTPSH